MRWTFRTILTVIVVTAATACGGKSTQAPGEPRFTSVRLTDTRESTEEKTVFTGDTPKVYAIFTIAAVPAGTPIKSVWIAEKTDVAPADHKIDEATLTMGGNVTSGTFSFSRPTNGWPAGNYRIELYIGERLGHTARFQVEATAPAALASPAAASPAPATPGATVAFASKGWAFENGAYVNARHGLRVEVPAG
jgi:hypothetical protein